MQYTQFSGKEALALIEQLEQLVSQLLLPVEQQQRLVYLQRTRELYNLCGSIRVQSQASQAGEPIPATDPVIEASIIQYGSREQYAQVLSSEFNVIQQWATQMNIVIEQRLQKLLAL